RAKLRQMYVLHRMHELRFIDTPQFDSAQRYPMTAKHGNQEFAVKADFLAEMVRQEVYDRYEENAYTQGIRVYTTIRRQDQEAAYKALRKGVMEYDQRHGYGGL